MGPALMEAIGVPAYVLVRQLGPPLITVVIGLVVLVWRRPPRRGLLAGALGLYLLAALLPYLWLLGQAWFGVGGQTWVSLIVTFLQPGLEALS